MTARVDDVVARVAASLQVDLVQVPAGGEFGAAVVRDSDGRLLILKAVVGAHRVQRWARGAALADRLHAQGYPAPRYAGTGVVGEAVWSLQEMLPGDVESPATVAHIEQLLALAERHSGNAGRVASSPVAEPNVALSIDTARRLALDDRTHSFAREVMTVLERFAPTQIASGDICHGDFHHRNFLAAKGIITGIFDWEGAGPGDWRFDVVTLAFWSQVSDAVAWRTQGARQFETDATELATRYAAGVCEAPTLALFGAALATRVVAFNAAFHPDWLLGVLDAVDTHVAAWWRT